MEAGEALELLERSMDQFGRLIERLDGDDGDRPTPCEGWTVTHVIDHVIGGMPATISSLGEEPPDVTGDPVATFDVLSTAIVEGWRRPGALERTMRLPIGEVPATWRLRQQQVEYAVHGWDVAVATGRLDELDDELAEVALEWARENLRAEFRGARRGEGSFGPEVEAPAGAGAWERLAAFMGRDPAFSAR